MFTGISFASVVLILVIAFLFRSSLKKANEVMPEVVNTTLGTLAKASKQLDDIVTVNCLESSAELNQRAMAVKKQIEEDGGLVNLNSLYNSIHHQS